MAHQTQAIKQCSLNIFHVYDEVGMGKSSSRENHPPETQVHLLYPTISKSVDFMHSKFSPFCQGDNVNLKFTLATEKPTMI